MIKIADQRVLWRHFRSTSGFIGPWKKISQKFLLHQKISRKISVGLHLVEYDSILWVLSPILTIMSVYWQIKAQLLTSFWSFNDFIDVLCILKLWSLESHQHSVVSNITVTFSIPIRHTFNPWRKWLSTVDWTCTFCLYFGYFLSKSDFR